MFPPYSCRPVRFETPRQFLLAGLWFGGERPRQAFIFVHGLGGSAFSHQDWLAPLAGRRNAVLYFNNRGHDTVAGLRQMSRTSKPGHPYACAGVAHEVFTDCVDDLQGAVNLCRRQGTRRIYLAGHSTGCQKIVYYLSRARTQARIAGAVLLCPISDYAGARHTNEARRHRAERVARRLARNGRGHELLPVRLWPGPGATDCQALDAQRFLSLYTPDSAEEIFTYAQPGKIPRALRKIKIPLQVILAGADEYADRPAENLAAWFAANMRSCRAEIQIVTGASHSFQGHESQLMRLLRRGLPPRA